MAMYPGDHWVLQDANYNVLGLVDRDGKLVERDEYTPYGERKVFVSSGANDPGCYAPTLISGRRTMYTWTGQWNSVPVSVPDQPFGLSEFGHQGLPHEEEIDNGRLIQNRHRVLHAGLGRFIQRDPLGYVDAMSLYQYVKSSPLNYVDAEGRWMSVLVGAGLGALGGAITGGIANSGGSIGKMLKGALKGAVAGAVGGGITGGLVAAGVPLPAAGAVGALAGSVASQLLNGENPLAPKSLLQDAAALAIGAAAGMYGNQLAEGGAGIVGERLMDLSSGLAGEALNKGMDLAEGVYKYGKKVLNGESEAIKKYCE